MFLFAVCFTPEAEIRFSKKREGYPGEGNPPSTASRPLFGGMGMKRPKRQTPQRASSFRKRRAVQRPEGQPPMSWFVHYSRSNGGEAANL